MTERTAARIAVSALALLLAGCNQGPHRSYAERMAAEKEACEKIGGNVKWVTDKWLWSGRPFIQCEVKP